MTPALWSQLALHLGAMLLAALILGQVSRRLGIPAVVGEIFGGVLVGATLLGRLAPDFAAHVFPTQGPVADARVAMMRTGMLAFIVTIGLSTSLREFGTLRRKAISVGTVGTFVPLGLGFAMAYGFPGVIGISPENQFPVAAFLAAIISLSANPIIARILMDLGLFHGSVGRTIMSATLVDDLVGWGLFAVILAQFGPNARPDSSVLWVAGSVLAYVAGMLIIGSRLIPQLLKWVDARWPKPAGPIGAIMVLVMFSASASEALGLHSFLGAFLVGILLADHYEHFKEALDAILDFSVAFITPIFFLSMGMAVDFAANFDAPMVLLITGVAFLGKVSGVWIGGLMGGMTPREALAVGVGMNARGILGMVMAQVAYESQLIDTKVYVACLVMCMLTTLVAGPALRMILGKRPPDPHGLSPADA